MDGVEIGRRRAAALFQKAESAGVDPWQPYLVAIFAAKAEGVTVEKVAKGHPSLAGARATYDPDFRFILHEDTGSPFSDAFLIGHELGHVLLGDDKVADSALTVDEERSTDVAPVGVDRVQDYGRNQRREIQMDLFARELLLPRSRARSLHIDENLTATQIADKLGAAFGVVAQQIFDALLLPEFEERPRAEGAIRALNEEQRAAAHHSGSPYLLEAGPGTGKTQTLVGRINWLLEQGADPREILVLTFSNKAAGELVERISATNPDAATAMWCGTFHAFGLDIIKRFADEIGMPPVPTMIDRADGIAMIERELPGLRLVHYRNLWDPTRDINDILQAISRAKDEVASPDDYRRLGEAMKAAAKATGSHDRTAIVTAEKVLEVARVYQRYEELKAPRKLLDFGDLVSLPVTVLERYPAIRDALASKYKHVLVDEYQDVNRSSVRLLKAIVGTGQNLWVVGDIKQSIYRFRGASSVNVDLFDKADFPTAKVGRLTVNYRSREEIVDAFSDFADAMKAAAGRPSRLTADRGACGHRPEFRKSGTDKDEIAVLVEAIHEMRSLGHDFRDQAVLCTGNDKLARFGVGLESLGVPVLYLGSVFERPEIKDLLSMLAMVADSKALGLARVATIKPFTMSMADLASIVAELRSDKANDWKTMKLPILGLSPEGQQALVHLRTVLAGFDRRSRPWDVLAHILLDRTVIAGEIGRSGAISHRAAGIAIWQFMNFIRNARGTASPILDMLDRIRRLVSIADDRDLRQLPPSAQGLNAVRLMTVHGSKGLEFPVVHLPGLTAASLPRSANQIQGIAPPDGLVASHGLSGIDVRAKAHEEEQECLFYVATSRARDRLICYSQSRSVDGKTMNHSPFIDRIIPAPWMVTPTLKVPPAPEDMPISIVFEDKPSFTGQQILQYEKCPRRFFYSYLLKVGGRQTETAFMRMHNATRHVTDWMVAQDPEIVELAEIERRLQLAFDAEGFDVSERAEYVEIARSLTRSLHENRIGQIRKSVTRLQFDTDYGVIEMRPDEAFVRNGVNVVRSIRTGHANSKSMEDLAAAAFVLAARQHPDRPRADLVFLGDSTFDPVELNARKLEGRRVKIIGALQSIAAGAFETDPNPRRCPSCPAFFFCGPVPDGILTKKVNTTLPDFSTRSD
ncbi:UvrD-helicase domain-containing protein [Rhizobium sp. CECT 9324]|uniref:UvrD-helicase domain-containing protein n=1 Tax=Rhizobium sp. CECT 9324 TaxID=2845820 RepID=UPI001E2CDA71|nr:UvrD-helicase domain-containing protein [Rhizobium sp. CECT 9324]CAH0338875.1 ATP-dependent DNA helicase Rep [Rhizobium sp. CECT 9324]